MAVVKTEREAVSRWCVRMMAAGVLTYVVAIAGADAQPAAPSARPSGLLGATDHRVPMGSDQWPWSAIGRINVVSPSFRGFCTGTLIGPRQVITAAHCVFNGRVNDWAKPESVHFVIGQSGEKFFGHSIVESFVISSQFKFKVEDRPRYDYIAPDMIKNDWAILTLHDALGAKPVPIRAVQSADLPAAGSGEEVALAGYGQDRQYVLSVHKGCPAKVDWPDAGSITHMCDSAHGQSGGPILLLRDGNAALIGIHSANVQRFESQVGYQALAGRGVSASGFEKAAAGSTQP